MRSNRLFGMAMGLVLLFGPMLSAAPVRAHDNVPATSPESVVQWNRIARGLAIATYPGAQGFVWIAYVQSAVYNAVAAIDGGYEQYQAHLARRPGASIDAAVAAAAHDVLAHYFPTKLADLDAAFTAALAAIPEGAAKTAGLDVGHEAAAALISLRQDDGLGANIGFIMPTAVPGVWELPAGQGPQTPWLSKLKPFLIERPGQFRTGPPPDLTSSEWANDFNEVKKMGRANSQYRTAEQTETALFWGVNPVAQAQMTLENIALTRGLDAMQAARLFAMGNLVGVDTLISCWDAKYTYLFWRPMFAIPKGDTDGNPRTEADPTWTPLVPTPPHPEYPSAHGCLTGSQAEVFGEFFGSDHIDVDIFATLSDGTKLTHHFNTVANLQHEVADARVWGGLHYRFSTLHGIETAKKVANYALDRYFLPAEDWESDERER